MHPEGDLLGRSWPAVGEEGTMATDVTVGTRVGERSPDWTLPRLDGGELGLRELQGKKVLLFFWASW